MLAPVLAPVQGRRATCALTHGCPPCNAAGAGL